MLIKQISTRTVFGEKADIQRLVLSDDHQSHFLYRIVGRAEGFMIGKGRHQRIDKETGEAVDTFWTKFAGDFVAINARGEEFESAIAFLPEYVSGPIANSLKEDPDAVADVKFDIYARYNKQSATSYEFVAQPLRSGQAAARALMIDLPALPSAPQMPALNAPVKKGKKKDEPDDGIPF